MPALPTTISKAEALAKHIPENVLGRHPERVDALSRYLSSGGIVRVTGSGTLTGASDNWPMLVYPTPARLQRKSDGYKTKIEDLERQKKEWSEKLREAEQYHLMHNVKKLSSPLFWRHMAKIATEPAYRQAADKVQLPVHLVGDPKWRPMIETFINNPDYRQQLTETVENSIIYKKDKRLARYANTLLKFRGEECKRMLSSIDQKITRFKEQRAALSHLSKWASEGK